MGGVHSSPGATLACPVTGGVHRAETGDITVLVGGAREIADLHEPALRAMGGRVIYLGGIEQAAVTKVVTNMLAFIHLIAAGEALMLCAKGGVDLRAAYDAIAAYDGSRLQGRRFRGRVRPPLRRPVAPRVASLMSGGELLSLLSMRNTSCSPLRRKMHHGITKQCRKLTCMHRLIASRRRSVS